MSTDDLAASKEEMIEHVLRPLADAYARNEANVFGGAFASEAVRIAVDAQHILDGGTATRGLVDVTGPRAIGTSTSDHARPAAGKRPAKVEEMDGRPIDPATGEPVKLFWAMPGTTLIKDLDTGQVRVVEKGT